MRMMRGDKLKILLIVPPNRKDFYSQLEGINNADVYILWHVRKRDSYSDELLPFIRGQYYWGDYLTPYVLLKKIKPDIIVFFEIIDLRQIALIVAARSMRINTFYLEHGAAGDRESAINKWNNATFLKNRLPRLYKRATKNLLDIVSAKVFYYSVYKKFSSLKSYFKFVALPFQMLAASPNKVLSKNLFRDRVPDYAIVFSEINFEAFELYTGLPRKEAFLTGVPFFDKYHRSIPTVLDHVVYIEHPYLEYKLLGWTKEHHKHVAEALNKFAVSRKMKLYIKLHPFSELANWSDYILDKEYVEILQEGDFTQLYLSAKLILGFSSSLITGLLCAKKNIVLLGWHPEPQIFGADFSETALCHRSLSLKDLDSKFDYFETNNLCEKNEFKYGEFLRKFNYPFDGKATERVIGAIVSHEVR
jgi:hypothetical protein